MRQFGETGRCRSTSTSMFEFDLDLDLEFDFDKVCSFFAKVRAHKAVQMPHNAGQARAPAFQQRVRAVKACLTTSMAGQLRALWRKAPPRNPHLVSPRTRNFCLDCRGFCRIFEKFLKSRRL